MPRRDWDPLADAVPPRYAYESDNEDEAGLTDVASPSPSPSRDTPQVNVTFLPPGEADKHEGGTLIVATGLAGVAWSRGAKLGEQVGQVNVNKRAVGLVFRPSWGEQSNGTVLVSEVLTRLPVWAISPYAAAILERWKPSKVVLLDAYSTATYIAAAPIPHHEAPLRYLSTGRTEPLTNSSMSLFAPPNLIQSTTAAFLNLVALPESTPWSKNHPTGLAILVPSRRAPLPTPQNPSREEADDATATEETRPSALSAFSSLVDSEDWDPTLLHETHKVLTQAAGFEKSAEEWSDERAAKKHIIDPKRSVRRPKVAEAEQGMYI